MTVLEVVKPMTKRRKPAIPDRVKLFRYFEDYGIPLEEVAEATGYAKNTLVNIRNGSNELTDSARFRFITVYPDTRDFLLPASKNND